jgi:putative FmdB family regulatory protein
MEPIPVRVGESMPLYEYACLDCGERFDTLRAMADADQPIACTTCASQHTSRLISLFAAHSEGRVVAGDGGGGCAGCSGGSCATCH